MVYGNFRYVSTIRRPDVSIDTKSVTSPLFPYSRSCQCIIAHETIRWGQISAYRYHSEDLRSAAKLLRPSRQVTILSLIIGSAAKGECESKRRREAVRREERRMMNRGWRRSKSMLAPSLPSLFGAVVVGGGDSGLACGASVWLIERLGKCSQMHVT